MPDNWEALLNREIAIAVLEAKNAPLLKQHQDFLEQLAVDLETLGLNVGAVALSALGKWFMGPGAAALDPLIAKGLSAATQRVATQFVDKQRSTAPQTAPEGQLTP